MLRLDPARTEQVARLNRALQAAFDGDSVGDLARVMRLPGTRNPKKGGGWARVLRWDGPTYRLEDLEAPVFEVRGDVCGADHHQIAGPFGEETGHFVARRADDIVWPLEPVDGTERVSRRQTGNERE